MRILYITWDGPQVSYLEGLFLPIFRALRTRGFEFHVLQFSWGGRSVRDRIASACARSDIPYRRVRVQRRLGGIGAFLSARLGARAIDKAVREWAVETLMPRSLMPAISVLHCRSAKLCKIVYDSDGLAADERVDFANLSAESLTYRLLRDVETRITRRANCVLVRTGATTDILWARAGPGCQREKFYTVANGINTDISEVGLLVRPSQTSVQICYLGSIGAQYEPQMMLSLAAGLRTKFRNLTFNVFTREHNEFLNLASKDGLGDADWISVRSLQPDEVQAVIAQHDAGFALRKKEFSTVGVAPIKIAEYLRAGVPFIGTPGVGDVDDLIRDRIMLPALQSDVKAIAEWLTGHVLPNRRLVREQCRAAAVAKFSLQRSVDDYANALESLG